MRLRERSARTATTSETSGKTPKTRAARIAWEVIGFAVEWAFVFAIAKRLANAFAQNADAIADLDADAFTHIQNHEERLTVLERSHALSSDVDIDRLFSDGHDNGQPPPTMVPKGRHRSTTPD